MDNTQNSNSSYDTLIRMIFLIFILGTCFLIMSPFLYIILWTIILTIVLYPIYDKLIKKMGGRSKLTALIIVLSILAIVIAPTWYIIESLVIEVEALKVIYDNGTLVIPTPDEHVKNWPIVGESIYDIWQMAAYHLDQLIIKYQDQLLNIGSKIGSEILSGVSSIGQMIISLFLAGIILTFKDSKGLVTKFFNKVGGKKGSQIADITYRTVGSVVKGVIGESFVMALLNGTAFMIAGVPLAGIWTIIAFILAVLQLPMFIITIPIMIYFFVVKSLISAIIWSIVLIVISFADNFLTPLMLGKDAPVPTAVIFIGVIGGFVMFGFIGLFTGAIIMSIGYSLFMEWINPVELK